MAGVGTHTNLNPRLRSPRLEARRRVYGPEKAHKALLLRVSAPTPPGAPFWGLAPDTNAASLCG